MTNNFENHDDFIEPEIGATEEPRSVTGNLAEAWRTRPMFKFMVLIVAVFAVFVAGFSFLNGNNSNSDITHIMRPPPMHEAPGGASSPNYIKQTHMADDERTQNAIASGGSALPTPIGATTDVGGFGGADKKDDPLNELKAEVDRLKKEEQKQAVQQQQMQRTPEQFDNSLAEAMQRQMQQLLDSWAPKGIKQVDVIRPEDLKSERDKAAAEAKAAAAAAAASAPASMSEQNKIVVSAGTVSYAQLLTEANSDVPGPILAQIVSGPLAGARAIGSFQVSMGYDKYLVLKFTLADKKGKDYQINAIALDPSTTLGGMATEVDERYMARVVLPAAAGFLQGLGQALGQGNTTITTNGTTTIATQTGNGFKQGEYNGLGQAAQTMGTFFQNQANLTQPLVRVAAGTPMGLFFTTPVMDPATTTGTTGSVVQPQQGANGSFASGNGYYQSTSGYNPAAMGAGYGAANGYPGTTVTGYGGSGPAITNSGTPYPNYAVPGYGYNGTGSYMNRTLQQPLSGSSPASPYTQGYVQ